MDRWTLKFIVCATSVAITLVIAANKIPTPDINKGTIIEREDPERRKQIYEFCTKENKDRASRGYCDADASRLSKISVAWDGSKWVPVL